MTVDGLQKPELAGVIESHDDSGRLLLMLLHMPLKTANMILEHPPRALEGIIDGKWQIGVALIGLRGARNIDLATVRKRQTDIDLVETAGLMVAAGPFQDNPARRYAAKPLLKLGHVLLNRSTDRRVRVHSLKVNFDRGLHEVLLMPFGPRVSET
jgi:hypothetical protein